MFLRHRAVHSKDQQPWKSVEIIYYKSPRGMQNFGSKLEWTRQAVFILPFLSSDSDHELLIAKFRLKLKKVGKTTRPFRYDLNQIPYDYTGEVRSRFKD